MIRVFPRKTNATPTDSNVFFTGPPLIPLQKKLVHVSCTFTWDKKRAESLAEQWAQQDYDVKLGGPAYDDPGDAFVPGRYLKIGNTITSRGCNNRCWFCHVWRREGTIRELPIVEGWNLRDSNFLQCSDQHIKKVFSMLKKQTNPINFTGGLESKILKDWHIQYLKELKIAQCYFSYDDPADYEALRRASKMIFDSGLSKPSSHRFGCYVLIGYKGDKFEKAENRLKQVMDLGFLPFAMLYRDNTGRRNPNWISFQAHWANPTKIYGQKKQIQSTLFNN